MKLVSPRQRTMVALLLTLLAGCSTDPNKQKLKYFSSGEKYFKQGKMQEAAIEFRNAVRLDPGFVEAHYQLARAYLGLRNPEAAYQELVETVELNPKNWEAQL